MNEFWTKLREGFGGASLDGLWQINWYTGLILLSLLVFAFALYKGGRGKWNGRRVANGAMCIAIAFVLSCIRLYRFPYGGSITPISMLPLVAFALACGPAQGALVGCAYGLLQLVYDPYVIHPLQLLADYPLAFGALALGGFAAKLPLPKKFQLPAAVVIGAAGRLAMATLSGCVFFADYAGEGQSVFAYSIGYNFAYLGPDAALCALAAFVPGVARIVEMLKGNVPE